MIKSPIQKPYFFDTKEGIDHFVKVAVEENPKKLDPKELKEIKDLGNDMKKSAYELHARSLKQFDGLDPKSYPSNPVQRGKLLEMGKLEKDLEANNINHNPKYMAKKPPVKRRNYWDAFVKLNEGNKGEVKLPKLTAEEIERSKRPSDWEVIYGSMSPFEKGQWNAQQRKEKLQKEKKEYEFNPEKMSKEVVQHVQPVSSVVPEKKADNYYPGAVSLEDSIAHIPVEHKPRIRKFEPGLSHNFTQGKLKEGKLIKEIFDE